jgi:hypothetical protein
MRNIWLGGLLVCATSVGCGKATKTHPGAGNASATAGGTGGDSGGATGGTGDSSRAGAGGDGPCADAARAALAEGCDSGRVCNYKGYAAYCASGDVDVTEAVYACLRGCQTVFDPGGDDVNACLDSATAEKRTATTALVESTVTKLCDDNHSARAFGLIAVMGGPAHAEKLASCLAAATTCSAADDCWGENGAGLIVSPECS